VKKIRAENGQELVTVIGVVGSSDATQNPVNIDTLKMAKNMHDECWMYISVKRMRLIDV